MATDDVPPTLKAYLSKLRELGAAYTPSLFWEGRLASFRGTDLYRLEQMSAEDLDRLIATLGYTDFVKLDSGAADPCQDPRYVAQLALSKRIQARNRGLTPSGLRVSKEEWEAAGALYFLRSRGFLKEYESWLRNLRIEHNISVARHFHYARLIAGLVEEHIKIRPINVIEIGAGEGNLAVFLCKLGLVRSYCNIDVVEMLLNAGQTITRYLPDVGLHFSPPVRVEQLEEGLFWLVPPQFADQLPEGAFDLCLNFNSLMEMDGPMVEAYFNLIYRVGRPGALFVNVNRRQRALPQRDGSVLDNNPMLYPYRRGDRVLAWEEDEFQQATRSRLGKVRSLAVFRACLINLPDESRMDAD